MFETEGADSAIADLVLTAVDQAGRSPRRWFVMLATALVGALAVVWLAKRATAQPVAPATVTAGAEPAHAS